MLLANEGSFQFELQIDATEQLDHNLVGDDNIAARAVVSRGFERERQR